MFSAFVKVVTYFSCCCLKFVRRKSAYFLFDKCSTWSVKLCFPVLKYITGNFVLLNCSVFSMFGIFFLQITVINPGLMNFLRLVFKFVSERHGILICLPAVELKAMVRCKGRNRVKKKKSSVTVTEVKNGLSSSISGNL